MIYENEKDRENQNVAAFQLQRHLTALGVTQVSVHETPEHRRECYDFEMHVHGMWTGVVEVKCLNYASHHAEEWEGLMVETNQLKAMRKLFYKTSPVTGKGRWDKEVVIVMRFKKDNVAYGINIRRIVELWHECPDTKAGQIKDNHGKTPADRTGKLIPLRYWERIE